MFKKIFTFALLIFAVVCAYNAEAACQAFYLSSTHGSDSNAGTSPGAAWYNLSKLNADRNISVCVYFESGSIFRSPTDAYLSYKNDSLYSSYNGTEKPIFLGSYNFSNSANWTTAGGNIWEHDQVVMYDVGNLILNGQTFGVKRNISNQLAHQGEYCWNQTTNKTQMYSTSNPVSYYNTIEAAIEQNIIGFDRAKNVTFSNLSVMYGAKHGFSSEYPDNVTVTNCEARVIGGAYIQTTDYQRYGNCFQYGLRVYNSSFLNNYADQCFDDGITIQSWAGSAMYAINNRIENNIINRTAASITLFWNGGDTVSNLYVRNNTIAYGGLGWSQDIRVNLNWSEGFVQGETGATALNYTVQNLFITSPNDLDNCYTLDDSRTITYNNITALDCLFGIKLNDNVSLTNFTYFNSNASTIIKLNADSTALSLILLNNSLHLIDVNKKFLNISKSGFNFTINQTWANMTTRQFFLLNAAGSILYRNITNMVLNSSNLSNGDYYLRKPTNIMVNGLTNMTALYYDTTFLENSTVYQVYYNNSNTVHVKNLRADTVNATLNISANCSNFNTINYTSDTGAYSYYFTSTNYTCTDNVVTFTLIGIEPSAGSNALKFWTTYAPSVTGSGMTEGVIEISVDSGIGSLSFLLTAGVLMIFISILMLVMGLTKNEQIDVQGVFNNTVMLVFAIMIILVGIIIIALIVGGVL